MEEQLVSFETAKLAKEKGFKIPVPKYYKSDGELVVNFEDSGCDEREYYFDADDFDEDWNDGRVVNKDGGSCWGCSNNSSYLESYSAPTQSLLQKWLRDVYKIKLYIVPNWNDKYYNCYILKNKLSFNKEHYDLQFESYEDALEAGLQEALKLIK